MNISIIVPAYNEERLIGGTLRHIQTAAAAFERRGWAFELIVCDNNSTDRTAELARAAGARMVFEPVNQIGRARNRGAAAAAGDWLLFVDADSWPSAVLLDDVAGQIAAGRCLAGGSTVQLDGDDHRVARFAAGGWNWLSRGFVLLAGSFIFCEADAFRRVGGFSDQLYAGEEIELGRRLKRLARATGKQVVILHAHPLLTSARKVHLYTLREHLVFFLRTILAGGRTLKDRAACHTWYDGRR
ncbi:MAG: glycosyltransferase [Opitutaceae bacterium]|nr:glycosyltransferase [Opitutaceae bacterium]